MYIPHEPVKAILRRAGTLFIAVLLTATVAPQIVSVKPATAAGDGGYPWISATQLNVADSDYGYYPTCPSNDSGCFSGGANLLYTDSSGHQWGEADPYLEALRNCTSYAAWMANTTDNYPLNNWGNASNWHNKAPAADVMAPASYTPVVGDLALWDNADRGVGHVAYVGAVDPTTHIATLWEYNVGLDGNFYNTRTTAATSAGTPDHYVHLGNPSPNNNFEAAFQAAGTGDQWIYGNAGTGDTGQGMLAGTSPSIAQLSGGGFETAFQNNTGNLWVYNSSTGPANTGQGMLAGTSPSITAYGSGYKAAFQANTGYLFTFDSSSGKSDTGQGMMAGTSPSIVALPGGGYEVAFQNNGGDLWVYGSVAFGDTGLGMKAGTSPSITAYGNGGYEVAFQNNTGDLWLYGNAGTGDQQRGMLAGTSPTIVGLSGGGYQTAFQNNTGDLWLYGTLANGDTGYGMAPGTSPSIALLASGGYEVAFQRATTGNLWTYGNAGTGDRGDGMASGTSPSIAAQ